MLKRTVPIVIASVVGFLLIFAKFSPPISSWENEVVMWFDILAVFAFVLGAGNLNLNNLKKISERKEGWGYAAITLLAFWITLICGIGSLAFLLTKDISPIYGRENMTQRGAASGGCLIMSMCHWRQPCSPRWPSISLRQRFVRSERIMWRLLSC